MTNVMHVIDSLSVGGSEWMLVSLVNAIDRQKYSSSVCVTRTGLALANEIRSNIPIVDLRRRWSFDLRGFVGIKEFSRRQKVDVYHAYGRSTFLFLIAAKKLGYIKAPILFHDHFGNIDMDQSIPTWFRLFGRENVDYYVGVYKKLADWAIMAGISPDKVQVIGNALDMHRLHNYPVLNLRKQFQVPTAKKIGIMVGNLRPAKGLDLLIEAYTKCSFICPPVIIIVGKVIEQKYVENCLAKLKSFGLEDNFIFAGQQLNSISWMKGADFGVMPSRSESGPLVLIEMMGCGLPIVAFKVGNISNVSCEQLPESFAKPEDTREFSELLQKIENSSEEDLIERGTIAKKTANQLFHIDRKLPQWYSVYQKILERAA
jgi:glycosyltransferase involved in cell wall biosynthesis